MDGELAYLIANASVIPPWLAMMLAPRARITQALIATPVVPALLAVVYAALVAASLVGGGEGGMGSLADLRVGFERDLVLLLAWVHYLSFDLFVGMWELRDAQRRGLSHWGVVPCLIFTLMLGPTGLLLYVAFRWFSIGSVRFDP
jgi:hypothetical protein